MNGIQALELLKQGEKVVYNSKVYQLNNGKVYFVKNGESMECVAFPINNDGFEQYVHGLCRALKGELFFAITRRDEVVPIVDVYDDRCNEYYELGNYFTCFNLANKIALQQALFRKLSRFSMLHGGDKIDWHNQEPKWRITYDCERDKIISSCNRYCINLGVYFNNEDTCNKAIEEFKSDLLEYYRMAKNGCVNI